MSVIALYNLLKRIPDATDDEVEKAVSDFASTRDVATKVDLANLETRIIEKMAKQDAKMEAAHKNMIMWMVGVGIAVAGIVIAVVSAQSRNVLILQSRNVLIEDNRAFSNNFKEKMLCNRGIGQCHRKKSLV